MKLRYLIGPVALLGALAVSVPAQAQDRRERGNRSDQNRGESAQRQPSAPRSQPADRGRADSTPDRGRPQFSTPNGANRDRQFGGTPQNRAVPRVDAYRGNRYERPRTVVIQPRGGYRSYGYGSYGSRSYSYSFRPRLRVGFGVFLGYPVPYPSYDPYAYPAQIYGSPYPGYGGYPAQSPGYPVQGPGYQVAPGGAVAYGGVSLDISPRDATVYVDGTYVGVADDFYDPSHPLSVIAGRHRIQVQAPGYQPLSFDVDVVSGQVIPYQGDLQP
jgi:PEGA domain